MVNRTASSSSPRRTTVAAQRPARREVEGTRRLLRRQSLQLARRVDPAQVHGREPHRPGGIDPLDRLPVLHHDARAQRLVAAHDLRERPLQRPHVQPAPHAQREGHVVGGAPRLEPVDEPEPLLRERQRELRRSRGTGTSGGACVAAPAPTRSASAATVGASKSARSGSSTPNASRTRETTRVARRECPPRVKKSSSTPTLSTPSTAAQIPASTSSAGVRGATNAPDDASGAGRARRSTFPFRVSGRRSSTTNAEGTMYSGRLVRRCSRSSPAAAVPTT